MRTGETQLGTHVKGEGMVGRRTFLRAAGAAAGACAAAAVDVAAAADNVLQTADGASLPYLREQEAYRIRVEAAMRERSRPIAAHPNNGDEHLYPNRMASYSKGLPHNFLGEVDRDAYNSLLRALSSGRPENFERIIVGGSARLVNPQAGLAFDLQGADSHALSMAPPPAFSSAEQAAEIGENYWWRWPATCRSPTTMSIRSPTRRLPICRSSLISAARRLPNE